MSKLNEKLKFPYCMMTRSGIAGLLTLTLLSSLFIRPLEASETKWVGNEFAQTRLIAAKVDWAGERQVVVGIELDLKKNWKTYWRTVGALGLPPQFDWTGSENLASAKVLYPTPIRFKDLSGTSIGYKGKVIFPVLLTAKDPNKPIKIKLSARYMLCYDKCVPLGADQSLDITESDKSYHEPILSMSLDTLPKQVEKVGDEFGAQLIKASIKSDKPQLKFSVKFPKGAKEKDFFVAAPPELDVPVPKLLSVNKAGDVRTYSVDLLEVIDPARFEGATLMCVVRADFEAIEQPCPVE